MAIQPIDLQTLFSQLDKVGKAQSEQKEGAQIQQALQGALNQRRVDERIRAVNEAQDAGEGPERVKDKPRRRGERGSAGEKGSPESKNGGSGEEGGEGAEIVTDPNLGKNIDLSG
jgi:hypothetical protein